LPLVLALSSEGKMRTLKNQQTSIALRKRRTTMKILNMAQPSTTAKLILGVLIATCVFTAAANAQPSFEGKFTLPYEVQWNHAVLPAGEYSIQVDALGMPTVLHSTSSGNSVITNSPIVTDLEKGAARLTVTIQGNERRVRSMNLPRIGKSLIFDPLTKTEREMFAKAGRIDAVPVITARK
jgi:hypothetical protein